MFAPNTPAQSRLRMTGEVVKKTVSARILKFHSDLFHPSLHSVNGYRHNDVTHRTAGKERSR